MAVNKWAFFWGLVIHLVLFIISFIVSSQDSFILFVFLVQFPVIFLIILIIILIINILSNRKKINIKPNISLFFMWFLSLFSIIIIPFQDKQCANFGSTGDLIGGYFLYEKLLNINGPEYCGTGLSNLYIPSALLVYILLGYILTLLLTIIRAYYLAFKNRNKDELNNGIPKTKILIGIGSLIIIISLILYSLFAISNIESNTDQILKAEPFNLHQTIRDDYFESGDYNSVITQKDGKILIGGNFTSYLEQEANRIIRLNTDGTIDTSFNIGTGFDDAVQTVVIQDDGKILVGGTFSTYQGSVSNRIIRLNIDGSIDTSFNVGNGFDHKYAYINTIAIQKDGKIIVAGNFGEYKGVSANRILRFNTDGSRDKTFTSKAGFYSPIYNIKIQRDGKILIAGGFEGKYYAQYSVGQRVVRLNTDGSLDNSFTSQDGFQDDASSDTVNVKFITEQSDGKIILVGDFDRYKGVPANGIIRINTDGSIDTSFNPQIQAEYDAKTVVMQPDGKILVGGDSKDFFDNRITTKGVIRLNTDGSKDETFSQGFIASMGVKQPITSPTFVILKSYNGFQENIRSIAVQSDGKIIVVGDFYNYQGSVGKDIPKGVARLNSDGTWDNTFLIMRSSPLIIK